MTIHDRARRIAAIVSQSTPPRLRSLAALLATAAGIIWISPRIYGFEEWVSGPGPRLVRAWALLAFFGFSAISAGAAVVRRLSPGGRPDGFWALSFTTGAALFALATGLFGWLHLIGPSFFVLLPLLFIAAGSRTLIAEAAVRRGETSFSALELVVLVFGVLCAGLVGLQTISPENINYDAAWYHLRAAERYALAGGMVRPPEGDVLLALPQAASWLYTWAFLLPQSLLDDKVRLALLLEFSAVLGTLAALPALVRTLCPSLPAASTRLSWVAFFFSPAIFIYDTGVMGGADHVAALWSVSTLITWFHARRAISWRPWVLFGIQASALLLAKYSSIYVLVPLSVLIAGDWVARRRRAGRLADGQAWGPLVAAGVVLVLTSPYWLRNWIWYHNPVYPVGSHLFPNLPWNRDADAWLLYARETHWLTTGGTFLHKVRLTLGALFNYQTELNTWGDMTGGQPLPGAGGQPIAGTIYFLSLLALPFIADRGRLLVLAVVINVGIAVWFNTHIHEMRYLTVLMAPMAAGAAAVALSLWRQRGVFGRLAVLVAVCWNLAAYADMPFRRTHRMARHASTVGVAESYLAQPTERTAKLVRWETIAALLPPDAVPLVHGVYPHLGLGRQSVTDAIGLQFGINYGRWGSIAEILRQLRLMGVTHLIWKPRTEQADSVSGEALFQGLVAQTVQRAEAGGFTVGDLPAQAREIGEGVLYLGCGNLFRSGLYTLEALKAPLTPPYQAFAAPPLAAPVEGDWRALLPRASYVVAETDCQFSAPPEDFTLLTEQAGGAKRLRFHVRTSGHAQGW